MNRNRHIAYGSAVVATAFLFSSLCAVMAGEGRAQLLNPRNQPDLIARSTGPAEAQRLLATRQARALGLDEDDSAKRLPAISRTVDVIHSMLSALEERHAGDLWLAHSRPGMLKSYTAYGCSWPDGGSVSPEEWLHTYSPEPVAGFRAESRNNRIVWIAAGDPQAFAEFNEGARAGKNERWRDDLAAFMKKDPGPLSLFVNVRPVMGVVSMFSGTDLRGKLGRFGLALPESLELNLTADTDLGFVMRVPRLITNPIPFGDEAETAIETTNPSLFRLNIPQPLPLLKHFGVPVKFAAAANINPHRLAPRNLCLDVWRDPDSGDLRWMVLGRLTDAVASNQVERLFAWLDMLAASPSSGLRSEPGGGDLRRRYSLGALSWTMGVIRTNDGESYLVAVDGNAPLPEPSQITVVKEKRPYLLRWNVNLDEKARTALASQLAGVIPAKAGLREDALLELLRHGDSGLVLADGDTLEVVSRRGMTPLAAVATARELAGKIGPVVDDPARLIAARLRFLLQICEQSRYRTVSTGNRLPSALPQTLSDVAYDDSDGERWLHASFPDFPGHGLSTSDILRAIAAGEPLEGYHYRIGDEGGEWFIEAENAVGRALRINAKGVLFRREGERGTWDGYADPLFGIGV